MLNQKSEHWVIMDVNRTVIAKGVPRSRHIVPISDTKKRILTYNSEKKAISGFTHHGFSGNFDSNGDKYNLEAVKVEISIKELP